MLLLARNPVEVQDWASSSRVMFILILHTFVQSKCVLYSAGVYPACLIAEVGVCSRVAVENRLPNSLAHGTLGISRIDFQSLYYLILYMQQYPSIYIAET